jgi:hypothetical protein
VALAGACPGLGWLAWPGDLKAQRADELAALDRQLAKLHRGGNFAEELPLLQGIQAYNNGRPRWVGERLYWRC